MGELSIKVNIAERIYPLKIEIEEEEIVRLAAKNINDKIRIFQENYSVNDKQDLLSMAILGYATEVLKMEKLSKKEDNSVSEKIKSIDKILSQYLDQV
jgi:cell division protein ZapA (FtsZ GTPase activity inhibitor)